MEKKKTKINKMLLSYFVFILLPSPPVDPEKSRKISLKIKQTNKQTSDV